MKRTRIGRTLGGAMLSGRAVVELLVEAARRGPRAELAIEVSPAMVARELARKRTAARAPRREG